MHMNKFTIENNITFIHSPQLPRHLEKNIKCVRFNFLDM